MALKAGDKAPDFKLIDSDKKEVSLSDYRGNNVILLFFPAAFSGVCTKELCTFRDDLSWYTDLNARVLAASVDLPFALAKFKELQNYNFPLLSDFNKTAATAYGAIYPEWISGLKGVAKRSAFVIDKGGIIRYAQVLESAGDLPDFSAIKSTVEKLEKEGVGA